MGELTIDIQTLESHPGAAFVTLAGAIDAQSVLRLKSQIASFQERGLDCFVLDMEKVSFVNSTGMSFLITLSDAVRGGAVPLVKVQAKVRVIFDMMNLTTLFRMHPSREEALAAIGTAGPAPKNGTAVKAEPAAPVTPPPPAPPVAKPAPAPVPVVQAAPLEKGNSSVVRFMVWAALAAGAALVAWMVYGRR